MKQSGEVVRDPSGNFKTGELVVMVPNTPVEEDDIIAENYLRSSKFRASGFDGFMRNMLKSLRIDLLDCHRISTEQLQHLLR